MALTPEEQFAASITANRELKEEVKARVFQYDEKVNALDVLAKQRLDQQQATLDQREKTMQKQFTDFSAAAESTLKYLHQYDIDLLDSKFAGNMFYPVLIPIISNRSNRFELFKTYSAYNRVAEEPAGLQLVMDVSGGTWGGNAMSIAIINNVQTYRRQVAAIGFMNYGYALGIYLKGGHKYSLRSSNYNSVPRIISAHTPNYTNRPVDDGYKLDCGPVNETVAAASAGAIPTLSSFTVSSQYINSLGGEHQGYYQ